MKTRTTIPSARVGRLSSENVIARWDFGRGGRGALPYGSGTPYPMVVMVSALKYSASENFDLPVAKRRAEDQMPVGSQGGMGGDAPPSPSSSPHSSLIDTNINAKSTNTKR